MDVECPASTQQTTDRVKTHHEGSPAAAGGQPHGRGFRLDDVRHQCCCLAPLIGCGGADSYCLERIEPLGLCQDRIVLCPDHGREPGDACPRSAWTRSLSLTIRFRSFTTFLI